MATAPKTTAAKKKLRKAIFLLPATFTLFKKSAKKAERRYDAHLTRVVQFYDEHCKE